MKVKDLKAAEYNPRRITDKKLDMLGKSMKEYGDLSGIIFNKKTGRLIGGHQRIKHLDPEWEVVRDENGEGFVKTPQGNWFYREVSWPEKKEIAANIAANRHGGEFDFIKLKDLIVEIDDGSIDIELTGFEPNELKEIFGVVPNFKPTDTNESNMLDMRQPIECPKCGFKWIMTSKV